MAEVSRPSAKDRSLEAQIKACKKSLAAAERSGRDNIAGSLRAKLDKLHLAASTSDRGTSASGSASIARDKTSDEEPRSAKVKRLSKKKGEELDASSTKLVRKGKKSKRVASADSLLQVKPKLRLKKRKGREAEELEAAGPKVESAIKKVTRKEKAAERRAAAEAERVAGPKPSSKGGSAEQSALELLLWATKAAQAADSEDGSSASDVEPPNDENLEGCADDAEDDDQEEEEEKAAPMVERERGRPVPKNGLRSDAQAAGEENSGEMSSED